MHRTGLSLNSDDKHILVVDEEEDVTDVIRFCLQIYGYGTCTFTDPLIALEHFKSNPKSHHMVICNIAMDHIRVCYKSKEYQSKSKSGAYDF